jgi:uncharacterized RDD family membrane protein YckC
MENSQSPSQESGAKSAGKKADLGKRFIAIIIDIVITILVGFIPFIGGLIGTAYMLLRDGLHYEFMDHRSVGKKLVKLRPVTLDGKPVDIIVSIKRNWMFALGALVYVLFYIPILGWALIPIVSITALALCIIELILVITDEEGRRWGDKLAETKVIEVSE